MTPNSSAHRPITVEEYRGKVMILSEGSINVRVDGAIGPPFLQKAAPILWPATAVTAVLIALISSAMTLYAVSSVQSEVDRSLRAQTQQFQERLEAAFADVRSRSLDQTERVLLRTDDLGRKLDLMPERIDDAATKVTTALSTSITSVQQALSAALPMTARVSPLLIRKRKTGM